MSSTTATEEAFRVLRRLLGQPRMPPQKLIANPDQIKPMNPKDGLQEWTDGNLELLQDVQSPPPFIEGDDPRLSLWVVRTADVVYALENCSFGKSLATGMIKHTNLTGGGPAYSGGELILLNQYTIVVNGRSGRYGPRNATELYSAVKAFADSGYRVWYMPWDEDANRPAPFGSFPNLFP
jgi:hypothetical protein